MQHPRLNHSVTCPVLLYMSIRTDAAMMLSAGTQAIIMQSTAASGIRISAIFRPRRHSLRQKPAQLGELQEPKPSLWYTKLPIGSLRIRSDVLCTLRSSDEQMQDRRKAIRCINICRTMMMRWSSCQNCQIYNTQSTEPRICTRQPNLPKNGTGSLVAQRKGGAPAKRTVKTVPSTDAAAPHPACSCVDRNYARKSF